MAKLSVLTSLDQIASILIKHDIQFIFANGRIEITSEHRPLHQRFELFEVAEKNPDGVGVRLTKKNLGVATFEFILWDELVSIKKKEA